VNQCIVEIALEFLQTVHLIFFRQIFGGFLT